MGGGACRAATGAGVVLRGNPTRGLKETKHCARIARDLECKTAGTRRPWRREKSCERVNTPPLQKKVESPKKPDFERSLSRLEEVVRKLESPQLSLDDAMTLFEEGVELSRECQKQLEEAEGRVEILLKKADGKMVTQPFDPEAESES
jgi:exodeoxyribonuclease VII small subunit